METKTIGNFSFVNRFINSRDGFTHESELFENGILIGRSRVHYLNRTWEKYTYQNAMKAAVYNAISEIRNEIISDYKKQKNIKRLKTSVKEELFSRSEDLKKLYKLHKSL